MNDSIVLAVRGKVFFDRRIHLMKQGEFAQLLKDLANLTPAQRSKLTRKLQQDEIDRQADDQLVPPAVAEAAVEECPHCGHDKLNKHGHASGLQRWLCTSCKKTFNALTETPLAGMRMKHKWLEYASAMIAGHTLKQSAELCQISEPTAFLWRHRFLQCQHQAQSQQLTGIAESDETYFYYSEKGTKQLEGKARKRGGDKIKRGSAQLVAVVVLRDRSGKGADRVITGEYRSEVRDLFCKHLAPDTLLTTDGKKGLCSAAHYRDADAHVCAPGKEARGGLGKPFHIQTVNAYHSTLKGWMRRFRGVATKYLKHYVGWHRHLTEKHHQNDPNRFILLSFSPLALNPQLTLV